MSPPPLGELRFAFTVLSTELKMRRRRMPVVWRRTIEGAAIVVFFLVLFM
jgi:hypothetical protein